ncbi:MAG: PPC domain-containing protein, partial [Acidobacteriota bacterium]
MKWTFLLLASLVWAAAPPVVTDLQPRGAKKGRPFTLTLVGRELSDVLRIHSTMPATFTPLSAEIPAGMMATPGRYASFLVEPKSDLATGVFPIRIETAGGISNIQLFSIGEFPELQEEETKPNSNDSIEAAQSLPASAVTVTGTLRGAERDFYRIPGKAGERRVIEVEGRRIGSAIDPVVRVFDQSGRQLAKSEDAPLLGLDARVDLKLPKDGFYYVEVHDARFSTQGANFYRLKSGSYDYPADLFPLGGKRGEIVEVSLGASTQRVDLTKVEPGRKLAYVSVPNAAALPLPFDVGEFPEVREPVADALKLPVTINGRIAKPGETDRYELNVTPGGKLMLEIKAREMGTSKLMAVVDVTDMAGKRLARAGDEPLPDNLYAVGASKTAGDPYLFLEVPKDVNKIQVSIEDLALRGGQHFAYRLIARPAAEEFTLSVNTPLVNVPAGGSVFVPVTIDRKGYMGPVRVRVKNAPEGLIVEGGRIPGQPPNT